MIKEVVCISHAEAGEFVKAVKDESNLLVRDRFKVEILYSTSSVGAYLVYTALLIGRKPEETPALTYLDDNDVIRPAS